MTESLHAFGHSSLHLWAFTRRNPAPLLEIPPLSVLRDFVGTMEIDLLRCFWLNLMLFIYYVHLFFNGKSILPHVASPAIQPSPSNPNEMGSRPSQGPL